MNTTNNAPVAPLADLVLDDDGYEYPVAARCDCCDSDAVLWVDSDRTRVCLGCFEDAVRAHLDAGEGAIVLLDLAAQIVERERVS